MITYWQQKDGQIIHVTKNHINTAEPVWVDARNVTNIDASLIEASCGIEYDHITDILDPDELSRIEDGEKYVLTIVRIPIYDANADVPYYTIPLGIILEGNVLITICSSNCEVIEDISSGHAKGIVLADFPAFIIRLLSRADITFLRYLKEINRQAATIQRELQGSIENKEIIKMLNLQKSLEYFTTSLSSNQLLLMKLRKTKLMLLDEEDNDQLDDIEIDNRQAIGMAETYSNILTSLMNTFTSVISNNLNVIMKKLTVINLVLMVPTFITSFFGMNVPLPFARTGWVGMFVISSVCLITTIVTAYVLSDHSTAGNASARRKTKNEKI
jgi:Mg2+ and Co2+ transporters